MIRSFDNAHSETITFYSPLTLIVGYNGSGKTTIIECLKYATTGDQPPNSKGGAFIHDPKLCGEKEVLAQVKLSFRATNGSQMVATRSLQLTVKKAQRTLKTLEGQLLVVKDGERHSMSSRVAELDYMMPGYLGVSKAIIDNVVFCHQDESLWPLSEPSTLKKKFDEIFEASKYTKVMDHIKVLKKNHTVELGKQKIIEGHEKENKDRGEKTEKRLMLLNDEIKALKSQSKEMEVQINEAQRKANEAWDNAGQFERIIAQLDTKRMEARMKQDSIKDLEQDIQEMNESDEELKVMLDQYEERAARFNTELDSKQKRYQALEQSLSEKQRELDSKRDERGEYQAEKYRYERQLRNRESSVKEIARAHNILGFDQELDESRIEEFMERISKMARDQNSALVRARQESQKEVSEAQVSLGQLNEQKSALNYTKENAKSQIASNDKKIANYDASLNQISVDEGARANLESTVQEMRRGLEELKSKSDAAGWDKKIRDTESELKLLDDKKDQLDSEVLEATKRAKETAQMDHLQRTLKENKTALETMKGAHGDSLAKHLGPNWTIEDIGAEYQKLVDEKNNQIKEAQVQSDGFARDLGQVDFKISSNREEMKKRKEKVKQYENEVQSAIPEGEEFSQFAAITESTQRDVDILKQGKALSEYFRSCRNTLKEHAVCRTCMRGFTQQKQQDEFEKLLDKTMAKLEEDDAAERLEQQQAELQALRSAAPSYDKLQTLTQSDIPAGERALQELATERKDVLRRSEDMDRLVEELKASKRDLDVIAKVVQQITKYNNDILHLENQIRDLSKKAAEAGSSRGLEIISEEQKTVGEQARNARKALNATLDDRDRGKSRLSKMEIDLRDANEKLKEAIVQLKERDALNSQREELVNINKDHRNSMAGADEKIQSLGPQIAQLQAKYDDAERRRDEKEKQMQEDATKTSNSVNRLKSIEAEIREYIDRNGAQRLANAEREIESIQKEQQAMQSERTALTSDINRLKDQERSHTENKRKIDRNLKYRRDLRALEVVRAEIKELENHNAEADRDRYMREASSWKEKRNEMTGAQATVNGELKSKTAQSEQLFKDWKTDYEHAALKYREASYKVAITKQVIEDLGKYNVALDKAIMQYHALKMEEINGVIDELWRKTYQGTDVDTILIRSDSDNAKGNKSYNYRVCMMKQDAEMDMRGRCSAGQKVLASIIIRLALAECFGVECGLIALDEPTTNLDRDNIKALAESLHDIIKARQEQSNFQLIVITHDEEFLRYMQCRDFADYYYRVSRNAKQKSEITKQSLAEVM